MFKRHDVNGAWRRFIDRVQNLTDYDRGVTVNVGKISGGQGKNTVPDRAEAWADFRFVTRADGEATLASVPALSPLWISAANENPVAEEVSVPCESLETLTDTVRQILDVLVDLGSPEAFRLREDLPRY